MWQAHHAPVQLSFFGENYTRERIDIHAIIAEAHRQRAHAMAQRIRETGEWLGRTFGPVFTAEIKPVRVDYHDMTAQIRVMQAKATAEMIRGAASAIASFVGKWVGTPLLSLRQRSVLVNELSRLAARMLADIGLVRGNIAGIASKAFPLLPAAASPAPTPATVHALPVAEKPAVPAAANESATPLAA